MKEWILKSRANLDELLDRQKLTKASWSFGCSSLPSFLCFCSTKSPRLLAPAGVWWYLFDQDGLESPTKHGGKSGWPWWMFVFFVILMIRFLKALEGKPWDSFRDWNHFEISKGKFLTHTMRWFDGTCRFFGSSLWQICDLCFHSLVNIWRWAIGEAVRKIHGRE